MEDGSARDGFDLLGEPITYSQAAVGGPVWEVPKARHKSANKILQCPIHNQASAGSNGEGGEGLLWAELHPAEAQARFC